MPVPAGASLQPLQARPARLARLLPPGPAITPAGLVEALGLWRRAGGSGVPRPRVLLNMTSTADGRATLGGRSGAISSPADRELFHALRAPADAILVGAGTIRTERYGPLIPNPDHRAERRAHGLSEEPLACVVTASLDLDPSTPLLAASTTRLVLLTPAQGELASTACSVEYVREARDGRLDLTAALAQLAERFGVRLLLCEGGPHLACELAAAGLLDELFLSLAPKLAGGEPAGTSALRILAGAELAPPVALELLDAFESDSQLFLRYGVLAPERVSRETTASSSDAS